MHFKSCWTSCKVFKIVDKGTCSSFEGLGRLEGVGECQRTRSLWRPCLDLERDLERDRCRLDFFIAKDGEKIPERKATTYPIDETTREEPRLAVRRPKSMKKVKKTHLPVRVFVAQQQRWRITCQQHIIRSRGVMVLRHVTFFLSRGYSSFFFSSRSVNKWFVAE